MGYISTRGISTALVCKTTTTWLSLGPKASCSLLVRELPSTSGAQRSQDRHRT